MRAAKGGRENAPTALHNELAATTGVPDKAAGRTEGPPLSKKSKKKTLQGSLTPSKGAGQTGSSQTSSSNPVRGQPTGELVSGRQVQVPGPRANDGEGSESATMEVPAHSQAASSDDLTMWQRAPPAVFAQFLSDQIEKALDAREQRAAATRPQQALPRAISSSAGEAAMTQFRDPLALQEEEEEEMEGEEEEEIARFSDNEEPTIEKNEQSPQFFKQEDIQLLINKTISALDLQDQADTEEPPAPDKTNNPTRPIKGDKGKETFLNQIKP
uniref:Uncharacterized protein n=1 Tax=Sphaerodactylus townsendi TaxID=933632 RepID=A0ACB8G148_9SAUR